MNRKEIRQLSKRYLFCVVTTTVVFAGTNVWGTLGFFQENGSRTAINASSPLTTFTSRYRPIRKLEKHSRRSSLQRPGFLREKKRKKFSLLMNGADSVCFSFSISGSCKANSHADFLVIFLHSNLTQKSLLYKTRNVVFPKCEG